MNVYCNSWCSEIQIRRTNLKSKTCLVTITWSHFLPSDNYVKQFSLNIDHHKFLLIEAFCSCRTKKIPFQTYLVYLWRLVFGENYPAQISFELVLYLLEMKCTQSQPKIKGCGLSHQCSTTVLQQMDNYQPSQFSALHKCNRVLNASVTQPAAT